MGHIGLWKAGVECYVLCVLCAYVHQLQSDLLITENSTDLLTLKAGHLFVRQSKATSSGKLRKLVHSDLRRQPKSNKTKDAMVGRTMCRPLLFKFRPSHGQVLIYPTAVRGTCWSCQADHQLQYTRAVPTVVNKDIVKLSLSQYLGKYVVVLFYPLDFTPRKGSFGPIDSFN